MPHRRKTTSLTAAAVIAGILIGTATFAAQDALPRESSEELVRTVDSLTAWHIAGVVPRIRVVASGTVRNGGYIRAKLLPFPGRVPPPDGIYEFSFTVVSPASANKPIDSMGRVEVAFDWFGAPDDAVGVRIRAGGNVMETPVQGRTVDVDNAFDPKTLVGKRFVASGEEARPGDVTQSALPQPVRVIVYPSGSITRDYRPDRLNVFIDANGTILDAYFG